MKKTVVILLILVYGSATMGATLHLHYCMNEYVGWSLLRGTDDRCDRCGMEEKDKGVCCKDEQKHFKLKVDHQKAGLTALLTNIIAPALVTPAPEFNFRPYLKSSGISLSCHAPPDIGNTRLNILLCVFRI